MKTYTANGREIPISRLTRLAVPPEVAATFTEGWRRPLAVLVGWAHAQIGNEFVQSDGSGWLVLAEQIGPDQDARWEQRLTWVSRKEIEETANVVFMVAEGQRLSVISESLGLGPVHLAGTARSKDRHYYLPDFGCRRVADEAALRTVAVERDRQVAAQAAKVASWQAAIDAAGFGHFLAPKDMEGCRTDVPAQSVAETATSKRALAAHKAIEAGLQTVAGDEGSAREWGYDYHAGSLGDYDPAANCDDSDPDAIMCTSHGGGFVGGSAGGWELKRWVQALVEQIIGEDTVSGYHLDLGRRGEALVREAAWQQDRETIRCGWRYLQPDNAGLRTERAHILLARIQGAAEKAKRMRLERLARCKAAEEITKAEEKRLMDIGRIRRNWRTIDTQSWRCRSARNGGRSSYHPDALALLERIQIAQQRAQLEREANVERRTKAELAYRKAEEERKASFIGKSQWGALDALKI